MEIVDCTQPVAADEVSASSFTRQDKGILLAATTASGGSSRVQICMNERHSHPLGRAVPSRIPDETGRID